MHHFCSTALRYRSLIMDAISLCLFLALMTLIIILFNNHAQRHELGPGYYLGIGPILSYARFLWTGMGESTNYYSRTFGSVCRAWINWHQTLIFAMYADIFHIQKGKSRKEYVARFGSKAALSLLCLDKGVIQSDGPHWLKTRGFFETALSGPRLQRSKELSVSCTNTHLNRLAEWTDPYGRIKVLTLLRCIVVDVTNNLFLGVPFDSIEPPLNENDMAARIQNYFNAWQSIVIKPDWTFKVPWLYKKEKTAILQLHDAIDSLVEKKREIIQSELTEFDDFTSKLIKEQEKGELTADDVRQCVLEMLIAAPDTVSTSVYFMLMLLNEHPEVEQRVLAEIDEMEQNGDQTAAEKIKKFQVLENFIKEALRFRPTVGFIMRRALKHDNVNGTVVAEGTNVILNIDLMMKTDPCFPKPHEFSLDNFDQNNPKDPEAFLPFGEGPRKCPGSSIGFEMVKYILLTLLSRYTMAPPAGCTLNNIGLTYNLVNQPPQGAMTMMTFYPRSKSKVNTQRTKE